MFVFPHTSISNKKGSIRYNFFPIRNLTNVYAWLLHVIPFKTRSSEHKNLFLGLVFINSSVAVVRRRRLTFKRLRAQRRQKLRDKSGHFMCRAVSNFAKRLPTTEWAPVTPFTGHQPTPLSWGKPGEDSSAAISLMKRGKKQWFENSIWWKIYCWFLHNLDSIGFVCTIRYFKIAQ